MICFSWFGIWSVFAWKRDRGKLWFITLQEDSVTCLAYMQCRMTVYCKESLKTHFFICDSGPCYHTGFCGSRALLRHLCHQPQWSALFHPSSLVVSTRYFICTVQPENPEIRQGTEESLWGKKVIQRRHLFHDTTLPSFLSQPPQEHRAESWH